MKYGLINMSRVLRVWDNPLLHSCVKEGYIPVPFYCFDEDYLLSEDTETGIPRMMGTRFRWLQDCIKDCKSHIKQYGLDLCVLVGNPYYQLGNLIDLLRGMDSEADIKCYTLTNPDDYELLLLNQIKDVCTRYNVEFKKVFGFSTFIDITAIFKTPESLPWYYKDFCNACVESLRNSVGIVNLGHYDLEYWPSELNQTLRGVCDKGLLTLADVKVKHGDVKDIRQEVLNIDRNTILENKAIECLNTLLNKGGILSYEKGRLQSSTMLSPLINNGVIAPYRVFNECLIVYGRLLNHPNCSELLRSKYSELLDSMLLGAFALGIANLEYKNVEKLSSWRYKREIDFNYYRGIEESKECINTFSLDNERGDDISTDAVKSFIRILMNRGYVSNRVRLAIGLCLTGCRIHPYVIRDLFRGFLIDYTSFSTYLGLTWCLGMASYMELPKSISIRKQLSKKEYDLKGGNSKLEQMKGAWNNESIDIMSMDFIQKGNRLPIRFI